MKNFLLSIFILSLLSCQNPFDLPAKEKKSDRDNSRFTTETQYLVEDSLILSGRSEVSIVNLSSGNLRNLARFSRQSFKLHLAVNPKEQMVYAFTWELESSVGLQYTPKIEKIDLSSLLIDEIEIHHALAVLPQSLGVIKVHFAKEQMFWYSRVRQRDFFVSYIRSSDLDRENTSTLFTDSECFKDFAIDESSERLYWMTDSQIFSSDLLGEDINMIVSGLNNAYEFNFDFEKSRVYVTERIGRLGEWTIRGFDIIDGTERMNLLISNRPIYSFTLDRVNDKLYYFGSTIDSTILGLQVIDLKTLKIDRVNFNYGSFGITDMEIFYSRERI